MEKELIITIGEHNNYNLRLIISKNNMKEMDFNSGDKAKITKLEEGKFLVEKEVL